MEHEEKQAEGLVDASQEKTTPYIEMGKEKGVDEAGNASTTYTKLVIYLHYDWACSESHGMLIHWLCLPEFRKKPRAEQLASCFISQNPVYWCLFIPTTMALMSGRVFHSFFGQGGPIREHEHEFEHATRVHWILPTDGSVFL